MDNLLLLSASSLSTEAAEHVPAMLLTDSSDSIRLIGFVLIIMMLILTILTITLICIEMRQDTLRKLILSISECVERMEKRMNETSSQEDDHTSQ